MLEGIFKDYNISVSIRAHPSTQDTLFAIASSTDRFEAECCSKEAHASAGLYEDINAQEAPIKAASATRTQQSTHFSPLSQRTRQSLRRALTHLLFGLLPVTSRRLTVRLELQRTLRVWPDMSMKYSIPTSSPQTPNLP